MPKRGPDRARNSPPLTLVAGPWTSPGTPTSPGPWTPDPRGPRTSTPGSQAALPRAPQSRLPPDGPPRPPRQPKSAPRPWPALEPRARFARAQVLAQARALLRHTALRANVTHATSTAHAMHLFSGALLIMTFLTSSGLSWAVLEPGGQGNVARCRLDVFRGRC